MNHPFLTAAATLLGDGIRWQVSEHGCDTLDFFGGLLLGLEYFTIILGEERIGEIMGFLARLRDELNPQNSQALARWITFGPVVFIAIILASGLFVWVVVSEARDPQLWTGTLTGDVDITQMFNLYALLATFSTHLLKPLLCLGLIAGVYSSRSAQSEKSFTEWFQQWKERQGKYGEGQLVSFNNVMVDFFFMMCVYAFYAAFFVGRLLIKVVFRILEAPLRLLGFVLEKRRMRRIAAALGLAMIVASYVIRMNTNK